MALMTNLCLSSSWCYMLRQGTPYFMMLRIKKISDMAKLMPSTIICTSTDLIRQTQVAGKKAVMLYPYMQMS